MANKYNFDVCIVYVCLQNPILVYSTINTSMKFITDSVPKGTLISYSKLLYSYIIKNVTPQISIFLLKIYNVFIKNKMPKKKFTFRVKNAVL